MTIASDPALRDLPDRVIRETLRHPQRLRAFLQKAVPALADRFDCDRARLLDRDFPMDDWHAREADLPFEIPFWVGGKELWALVVVLIEHQTDTDRLMPLRLLLLAALYWDRQWRAWRRLPEPRPKLRLHPVLPIVLYTGSVPWGSTRTLLDLLGEPAELHPFAPRCEPLIWNLAEQTPEALLASASEWLKALAVLRVEDEDEEVFREVFTEAFRGLVPLGSQDPVRWSDLMRMLFAWAFWRRPKTEHDTLVARAQATQPDPLLQKEIQGMRNQLGPTIADVAMKEGEAKGKREGQLQNARAMLRVLLEDRFTTLPETLLQRIDATDDLDCLQTAVRQVYKIQSLDELPL